MTKASDNPFPSILVEEATEPSAPAAGHQRLYIDSTTHKLKRTDSSGTDVTIEAAAGIADQGAFTYLDATEAAAPGTPASGKVRIYSKTDGRIYSKDDAGTEYGPFDSAGTGGGPLLYIDSLSLHADGDDFDDDALTGWSTVNATAAEVTTEEYDDTCLDITFPAQGDRIYKAIDSGDWEYYLTIHGITNSTPSPDDALDAMIGLAATNDSGTGTGFSLYGNPDGWYLWTLASHVYSSTAQSNSYAFQTIAGAKAAAWPIVYRLRKVSTTIYGGVSIDGGLNFVELSRTDSTTFTRICITRMFSSGGTNPKLRVGRFNLVP